LAHARQAKGRQGGAPRATNRPRPGLRWRRASGSIGDLRSPTRCAKARRWMLWRRGIKTGWRRAAGPWTSSARSGCCHPSPSWAVIRSSRCCAVLGSGRVRTRTLRGLHLHGKAATPAGRNVLEDHRHNRHDRTFAHHRMFGATAYQIATDTRYMRRPGRSRQITRGPCQVVLRAPIGGFCQWL
jgi:hypothetical protein